VRILNKLKQQNFKVRLIATTIVIFLLSIFVVSLLSYQRYTRDFQQKSNERTQQILDQLSLNIDNYIDDLFRLSLSPYNNLQVLKILSQPESNSEYDRLQRDRQIEDFLNQMIISPRLDILQAYIISDRIYTSGRATTIEALDADYKNQSWYKSALTTEKPIFLPAKKTIASNPNVKVFSIVNRLRSPDNIQKTLGVLKVDANYSGIENICNKVNLGDQGGLLIVDQNENIIYSSISSKIDLHDLYLKTNKSLSSQFNVKENGELYLAASSRITRAGWNVISLNSVSELNRDARVTRNFTLLTAVCCSILACLILLFMIRQSLRPLLQIVSLMKQVKKGNLSVRFPENRSDEIGYLGTSFNSMVSRIDEMLVENTRLTKEVYETRFLQKEAQMNALFSQIRPHFIYNNLHTIGAMIHIGHTEQAMDNLEKLSLILRGFANIDKDNTLQKEIELLEAYLDIQKSRFGNRLDYSIEIDPVLLNYPLPALVLQPLVENSVIHGCEERKEKTMIRIYTKVIENMLEIIVEDNANGMSEEKLKELYNKMEAESEVLLDKTGKWEPTSGIGLINVYRRIRIRYGEPFTLHIESKLGEGTVVRLLLPYYKHG
jgi:two-component system, sensor histidine kinase YesM